MKGLRESPTGFHICLEHDPIEGGMTTITYNLGGENPLSQFTVTTSEARTIAAWFVGLAAELEASEEVGNGDT